MGLGRIGLHRPRHNLVLPLEAAPTLVVVAVTQVEDIAATPLADIINHPAKFIGANIMQINLPNSLMLVLPVP